MNTTMRNLTTDEVNKVSGGLIFVFPRRPPVIGVPPRNPPGSIPVFPDEGPNIPQPGPASTMFA
jgi:hypothetical protein